ncbi:MAG: ParB/RepB/Spo0J family partition protein [Candidatus Mycalebacterium zealandia]|nr:MAG: ParB/RepB/Spo0J family partition protein [Candidatus Mycalebacterium zealandia]
MRKNTLGKGLEALIGDESEVSEGVYMTVPTVRLKPGATQPRTEFNSAALDELAVSIREKGLIQPLIVRKSGNTYEIIAGERRWRAAQKAGVHEVPVIVRDLADGESLEMALIENIQREDLNPVEEALAYEQLISEYGLTHEDMSKRVGKSRAAITNSLRILKLSDASCEALVSGGISTGHARALLGLKFAADEGAVVERIVSGGLSVRQTEQLVKTINASGSSSSGGSSNRSAASQPDIYLKRAERSMREALGAKVSIKGGREKGSIVIQYSSPDDLERLSFEIAGGASVIPTKGAKT